MGGRTGAGTFRGGIFALLSGLFICFLLLAAQSSSAAIPGGKHSFDALLSLTGGTGTSPVDPVPDPGPNHPSQAFLRPGSVAVDTAGDLYVATLGWIDIFNPSGEFITEIKDEGVSGDGYLGVDSLGNLYVDRDQLAPVRIWRYSPSSYPPTSTTTYGSPTEVQPNKDPPQIASLAVNPLNDHLLVVQGSDGVVEYGSAAEGNVPLKSFGQEDLQDGYFVAVDASTGNVFVSSTVPGGPHKPTPEHPFVSVIYVFDSSGQKVATIDGSETPAGGFVSASGRIPVAVDEATGEVFVSDIVEGHRVYRFLPDGSGGYEYVPDPQLEERSYSSNGWGEVAVSNAAGAANADHVFVSSASFPEGHVFAFAPERETGPPVISGTGFDVASETEASLSAEIDPHGLQTTYHFEYVDDAAFQASGFTTAVKTPEGLVGAGTEPVSVGVNLSGLSPGTEYHFRVVAQNCEGEPPSSACVTEGEHAEGSGLEVPHEFATFPSNEPPSNCPNAAFRVGPSAYLPDCRAYEAVSPPHSEGHPVTAAGLGSISNGFPVALASTNGESVLFETTMAPLPGLVGNGYVDRYRAARGPSGWVTQVESPSGAQMEIPNPGGASADLTTSFWMTSGGNYAPESGSLMVMGDSTTYIRRPDGSFELLGQGQLGTQPKTLGRFISPGGGHVIFTATKKLEEGAPEAPQVGIYDRTSDGVLHVISLLPGDAPLPDHPGTRYPYLGASADGTAVAFLVEASGTTTTYVRVNDETTIEVAAGDLEFAGLSSDGSILTYTLNGNVFSFDIGTESTTQIGSGGQSTVANVSADGRRVYFISSKKLTPGAGPVSGKNNFYVWDRDTGIISFIGIVTATDVSGEGGHDGLGLWTKAMDPASEVAPGIAASRTTDDGRFLVFESRANLTGQSALGKTAIYLYDAESGVLRCISCNPTLANPTSGGYLETLNGQGGDQDAPLDARGYAIVRNIRSDGRMAFFETREALVARDSNGVQDVYEWEDAGVGGCKRQAGCLSLISLGRGGSPSYLYAVGAEGRDVFIATKDALVPGADEGTLVIYDARENGGFPVPTEATPCQLDSCQSPPTSPGSAAPGSAAVVGNGNVPKRGRHHPVRCKKNQRKVRRHGRVRCVRKKRGHHSTANGRGGK
jgi:hypothetical protein